MSTRRARIKAVAALPQRRKNVDNANLKKKQEELKAIAEIALKSPKNRRTSVDKRSGNSPARIYSSPRKSPRALIRTPDLEKVPSDRNLRTPTPVFSENRNNTPLCDKTDANRRAPWRSDIFVSPQTRGSPVEGCSPIVKTPIIEVDVGPERQITAHRRLLELQEDSNKHSDLSESLEISLSPKWQLDAIPSTSKAEHLNIFDGYNSPNTPESSDLMDGIVPLKPDGNVSKPIDLLKSEIISENAEVLFDPIVPLPSSTKIRQKLRPAPRLARMRRNSLPGSASESDEEGRRALSSPSLTPSRQRYDSQSSLNNRDICRVRNDSASSSTSQSHTPTGMGSPLKDRNHSKTRRQEVSRRMAAMRRRKESVQRDKLTMFDLIFYNPVSNPIVPDQDEIKAKEAAKKEEEQRQIENKKEVANEDSNEATTESAAPVPQIKLGPNGEIMLDEQSLVIKQSEQRKLSDSVVHEGAWMSTTGRVYRRTPRTAEWTDAETIRFYRALAVFGTDFSLMVQLFPDRSRRDLKLKFKKEERCNLERIDKALRSVAGMDADQLEAEFEQERRIADEKGMKLKERLRKEKKAEKERCQTMKERKVRRSKGSTALGTSILPGFSENATPDTANDLLVKAVNAKLKRQREIREQKEQREGDQFATLTPIRKTPTSLAKVGIPRLDMATIQRTKPSKSPSLRPVPHQSPIVINAIPAVPADIAPGSLVVLTVDDPKAPTQKAIHTYIKQVDGSIASIILDPNVMTSLVHYVKNDTPKASSSMLSPNTVGDRTNTPPVSRSPNKRKRLSSYTITEL